MFSPSIQKLIKEFSKFPTVGPRTASRFVFYLIKAPQKTLTELIESIKELKNKIRICPLCFNSFEPTQEDQILCPICASPTRDKETICIVEKEIDLEAIEKTKEFNGIYFVLGGTITGLNRAQEKKAIEERVNKLYRRIKNQGIKEIILGLNPTTEGQNTTLWLRRRLEPLKIKITQLGRGLPMGGELEYADKETLTSAFEGRR